MSRPSFAVTPRNTHAAFSNTVQNFVNLVSSRGLVKTRKRYTSQDTKIVMHRRFTGGSGRYWL
jgi:hypothetical protein